MTWKDRNRWELIGLLDDMGQEWLQDNHPQVYTALREGTHTRDVVEADAVEEFDIHLAWLLRTQGVPV